jgi:hypothetical protein
MLMLPELIFFINQNNLNVLFFLFIKIDQVQIHIGLINRKQLFVQYILTNTKSVLF